MKKTIHILNSLTRITSINHLFFITILPSLSRLTIVIVGSILYTSCSSSKYARINYATHKYSPAQLQADFIIAQKVLQANHPSYYWNNAKTTIDSAFATAKQQLQNDSLTEIQFKKILSQAISTINCGHTSVRSSKGYEAYLPTAKIPYIPVGMRIYSNTMVAAYSLYSKDSALPNGSIINSINGISASAIITNLSTTLSTDGTANNFKNIRLTNNFPYYYYQYYGVQQHYIINYIDTAGNTFTKTIKPYLLPKQDSISKKNSTKVTPLVLPTKEQKKQLKLNAIRRYTIDTVLHTATITLNSFSGGKLPKFYREVFAVIKQNKCTHLILDVRNNGGGTISNATKLNRYLLDHKQKFADTCFAVNRFGKYSKYIKHRFYMGLSMLFVTHRRATGYHFGYFERHYDKPKRKNHYSGKVYVITGGYSFSATTIVLNALVKQANVITVGEPTGGGAYGNTAVYIPNITLPNTKLRVRLPLYRLVYNSAVPNTRLGFTPQYYVPPTPLSIALGKDGKMEKVISLIKGLQ